MNEMGKLLANLVESARAAKLARARDLEPKAPSRARPQRADTKKNRTALVQAVNARNLSALQGLLDIGALLDTAKNGAPLLDMCAQSDWREGFSLLLESGATTEWDIPAPARFLPGLGGWSAANGLFSAMAEIDFVFGTEAIWDRTTPSQIKKGISLMSSFEAWEALDRRGLGAAMDPKKLLNLASNLLCQCTERDAPERPQFLRTQAAAAWTREQRTRLWIDVMDQDDPELISFACSAGVPPHPDGSILISPKNLLQTAHISAIETYSPWTKSHNYYDTKHTADGRLERLFSLAELECARLQGRVTDSFLVLVELPEFMEQIKQSSFAHHCLAQARLSPEMLRDLASRGLDLSSLLDAHGRNPPHHGADDMDSKSKMERLATLCEPWIHQRDVKGNAPLDLVADSNKAAFTVVFDKIGMREALGKKRGTKAKPKSRRL